MKRLILLFSLIVLAVTNSLFAQDTLPKFTVKNVGANRIVLGWINRFEDIRQISIQRSMDSLSGFKTILTVADPTTPENGYVDTKAVTGNMFYRLYILLDKGVYLFSPSKRPLLDTIVKRAVMAKPDNPGLQVAIIPVDSLITSPPISNNRVKPDVWHPSKYVYTFKDGYIRINLPADTSKKYSLKFFTAQDEPLFELKDVKEKSFRIDKANFYKAGWYKFELYEGEELMEKNKFFLPKEF